MLEQVGFTCLPRLILLFVYNTTQCFLIRWATCTQPSSDFLHKLYTWASSVCLYRQGVKSMQVNKSLYHAAVSAHCNTIILMMGMFTTHFISVQVNSKCQSTVLSSQMGTLFIWSYCVDLCIRYMCVHTVHVWHIYAAVAAIV